MATKEVGIRLSVKDKELVERALKGLGKEGQEALQRIEGSADKASVSLQALNAAANGVNRGMERLKTGAMIAVGAMAAGFAIGIKNAVQRLEEMDRMSSQVDRALTNTGNTAQTSAAELAAFADQLELRTGRAAEEIMAIGGNLATFKFDNEVFYRSIELANDMSAAWGGELKQNLEGLARALADPEKGFAMLEKRGISLTEAQGDLVARFVAINDLASAQRVILDALEADVKGVAEQGMTPLQKATLRAEKALEDLFEDLVRGEEGSEDLRVSIEKAATTLSDPNVLAAVRMFGTVLVDSLRLALEFIGGVAEGLQRLIDFFTELDGKSDAALNEQMSKIGLERVDLENANMAARSSIPPGGRSEFDVDGVMSDREALAAIDERNRRLDEIAKEEGEILAVIQARRAAANLTAPITPSAPVTPGEGGAGGDLPPPVPTNDEARAQAQAMREAERLTERLRTAVEAYHAILGDLDVMLSKGLITQETHSRAVADAVVEFAGAVETTEEYRLAQEALALALQDGILTEQQYTEAVEAMTGRRLSASRDWISGIERGLNRIANEGRDTGKGLEDVLVNAASGFEDALVKAFQTGKFEWDDLMSSIAADTLRMAVRQGTSGLAGWLGELLGGAIGGSVGRSPLRLGLQAGVGHEGAIIGYSAVNRIVDAGIFARAPRHHTGTPELRPGEVPFIGMKGEEIGWPSDLARKYGSTVEVHVHPTTGQTATVRQSETSRGGRRIDVLLNEMVGKAISTPRGPAQQAMAGAGALVSR